MKNSKTVLGRYKINACFCLFLKETKIYESPLVRLFIEMIGHLFKGKKMIISKETLGLCII